VYYGNAKHDDWMDIVENKMQIFPCHPSPFTFTRCCFSHPPNQLSFISIVSHSSIPLRLFINFSHDVKVVNLYLFIMTLNLGKNEKKNIFEIFLFYLFVHSQRALLLLIIYSQLDSSVASVKNV
jgi:hypothetical protein